MAFTFSLNIDDYKQTISISFILTILLPLLIMIYIVVLYIIPSLTPLQITTLGVIFGYCLSAMLLISLLGFLLITRTMATLAKTADLFRSRSTQSLVESKDYKNLGNFFSAIFQIVKNLRGKKRSSIDAMSTFIDVASTLASELDFDRLFPLVIHKITEAMSAERTTLYIIDWDENEIYSRIAEEFPPVRLAMGEGISGRVAESGETINVEDAWDLPYFKRDLDIKNNFRTKSVLCMPMMNRTGERIGVIQLFNKKGEKRFDTEDEIFLKDLASQAGIALENSLLLEEIMLSFDSSISTLSATVDARHPFTAGHSERVTEYSLLIAKKMGMGEEKIEVLKYAALLHDIGKIGICDNVLLKYGQFKPEERREMETHPQKTKAILEKFRFPRSLREVPQIAFSHHERIDGTGYPDGLTGDQLCLRSKILSVADVFDAITSRRDYPKYAEGEIFSNDPMPLSKAISLLDNGKGTQFDSDVVESFLKILPLAIRQYRGSHFGPEYTNEAPSLFLKAS